MRSLLARDEREAAIDSAGDRLAYLVLSYGLLVIVAYRAFVDGQPSWELLGLVVLGGAVSAGYRGWKRALTRELAVLGGLTIVVAAVVAALLTRTVGG